MSLRKTVYKYELAAEVALPVGAEILRFEVDPADPAKIWFWVLVELPIVQTESRFFKVVGTGHPIAAFYTAADHLATTIFQSGGDFLVWHIFEADLKQEAQW